MNKTVLGILVVVVIVLGGWAIMGNKGTSSENLTPPPPPGGVPGQVSGDTATGDTSGSEVKGTATTYTMAEVTSHNTAESCWSTINGNVYDLTQWITKHPGGPQAIIGNLCGKDGTAAFTMKHSKDERPQETLPNFQIGVLAQ